MNHKHKQLWQNFPGQIKEISVDLRHSDIKKHSLKTNRLHTAGNPNKAGSGILFISLSDSILCPTTLYTIPKTCEVET